LDGLELVLVCQWKTPRRGLLVAKNSEAIVESVTGAAFATQDEAERMQALCRLRGVQKPTASVLLHFAFPDRYPIIDYRALESPRTPASP
jgi:endonuclease III